MMFLDGSFVAIVTYHVTLISASYEATTVFSYGTTACIAIL